MLPGVEVERVKSGEAGGNLEGDGGMCYILIGVVVTGYMHLSKLIELRA